MSTMKYVEVGPKFSTADVRITIETLDDYRGWIALLPRLAAKFDVRISLLERNKLFSVRYYARITGESHKVAGLAAYMMQYAD